jgi:hypothetical protein
MTDTEDPEVVAIRERAERVMARRAKERAEATAPEEGEKKKKKKGRQWYHTVFDVCLFLLAAYLIKTKFFDKQAEPAAPAASASASPSAAPRVVTRASANLMESPSAAASVVEALPPSTPVEVLELSTAGFMKVKAPSGKTGFIPAASVQTK